MICLKCNSFRSGFVGRLCPVCSEPLQIENDLNRDKLVIGRMKEYLSEWQESGKISKKSITEFENALETTFVAEEKNYATNNFISLLLKYFQDLILAFFVGFGKIFEPIIKKPEDAIYIVPRHKKDLDASYESATDSIFTSEDTNLTGLDALSDLDTKTSRKGKYSSNSYPTYKEEKVFEFWSGLQVLFNEYIWWFIGSILVLAGSIMGIREAWNTLAGVNRHLTVLAAVVVYQFLFVGLGTFIGKRLSTTGKLLSSISLLLLPVSYSVSTDLLIANFSLGIISLSLLVGLTAFLLYLAGNQFNFDKKLSILLVIPSLLVQSILPWVGNGIVSISLSFLPLVFIFISSKLWNKMPTSSMMLYFVSVYVTLGTEVIQLNMSFSGNSLFAARSIELGALLFWLVLFSFLLSNAFGIHAIHFPSRKLFTILEVIFLAFVLVVAGIAGLLLFSQRSSLYDIAWAFFIITPFFATGAFLNTVRRHRAAIHPFMVLSVFSFYILGNDFFPATYWGFAFASIVPILGLAIQNKFSSSLKDSLIGWGFLIGLLTTLYLFISSFGIAANSDLTLLLYPLLFVGFYFGIASHIASGFSRAFSHLNGGYGIFLAVYAILYLLFPNSDSSSKLGISLIIISFLYAVLGILLDDKLGEKSGDFLMPFDDISFVSGLGSFFFLFFMTRASLVENGILFSLGLLFISRSFRDMSSLSSFIGSMIFSLAGFRILFSFMTPTVSSSIYSSSLISLGLGILCLFFPNLGPTPTTSRKILYIIRLPFAAQGPVLIRNGLTATAFLYIIQAFFLFFLWAGIADLPERNTVILSMFLLSLFFLLGFFTRALNSFRLRGSVVSLSLVFIFIGLTAVANRIGRPLPPQVVGVNLTLGIIALWIFSRLLFYKGQPISNWLDNPEHGKFYQFVPLAAMCVLGLVLVLDIFLIQPTNLIRFLYVTPPTFFLGAGLAALLFFQSTRLYFSLFISLFFIAMTFGLGFSQESLRGISLTPLDLPGSRWVPLVTEHLTRTGDWLDPALFLPREIQRITLISRFVTGIATTCLFYAVISGYLEKGILRKILEKIFQNVEHFIQIQSIFSIWTFICFGFICLVAYQYAFIPTGVLSILAGGLLVLSGQTRQGNFIVGVSLLLIIHGIAHATSIYPDWTGLLLSTIALVLVASVKPISDFSKKPYGRILESHHAGAFIYSLFAFLYSLAIQSPAFIDNAVPGLLSASFNGIAGGWMTSYVLGVTFLLTAISLWIGAWQWTKGMTSMGMYFSIILFGFSGIALVPYSVRIFQSNTILQFSLFIPYFALVLSFVAAFALYSSISLNKGREDISIGAGYGGDSLFLLVGLFLTVYIRTNIQSNIPFASLALLFSILLVIAATLVIAFILRKPHHFYFAQTGIASLYLILKPSFPELLTPEVDALFALIFGFILTGITAVARSAGIPPLEESTRRFAAFMPVIAGIVLPTDANYTNAGLATFSAALYAALASTSSSKVYSVLAAVAASLAIFTGIMASNTQGYEIYLAPVGLFSLFLGHIFRENLIDTAKKGIRLFGGLMIYLPAAINISFELGQATDPMYAIVFGVISLAGVVAGMLFQIRSYLFMGVLFFTLNIVVNLLQTGLRDQRMGFILLSLAGLTIIFSLIFYSLRKEMIHTFIRKWQKKLGGWEG